MGMLWLLLLSPLCQADIVKPTLVEISINTNSTFRIEVRASIEALLTGINARYRDTREAPTAEQYDEFRVMSPAQLRPYFLDFQQQYLQQIQFFLDEKPATLRISEVTIPEAGYTKVPRTSVIILEGTIPRSVKTVRWYYPGKFADNAVRVRQVDEQNQQWHWSEWQWLRDDAASEPFALDALFTRVALSERMATYLLSGFEHILPGGLDHILFIVGIFLLSTHMRPLIWQVTMFTIAHTITLGAAMYGLIELPAQVVEPLIALSIAYIGIENILSKKLLNRRLFIVFAFGLLHGLGFASVLSDFGMPEDDFAIALISFNIGVEFGQLAIILLGFLLVGFWFSDKPWYRKIIIIPSSLGITMTGFLWAIERLALPL